MLLCLLFRQTSTFNVEIYTQIYVITSENYIFCLKFKYLYKKIWSRRRRIRNEKGYSPFRGVLFTLNIHNGIENCKINVCFWNWYFLFWGMKFHFVQKIVGFNFVHYIMSLSLNHCIFFERIKYSPSSA